MFVDCGTAAWTCAYDMPTSIAANSSPHKKTHDSAFASRANASGSATGWSDPFTGSCPRTRPPVVRVVTPIGSDDAAGTLTMIYFDERDISRRYTVEVSDGEVRWHQDEARSPRTAPGSTRGGRCRATTARGKTTCSSPTSASTRSRVVKC